jgi:hypothetical protein
MIRRLKAWVAKALILPIIQRDVVLLTQQADRISLQLTHWETQAAAWQATLVNEQLKIRSILEEMDIALQSIAASPPDRRSEAGMLDSGNSEAVVALAAEIMKLRADLVERSPQKDDERFQ